jgi:hypothetical protein
LGLDSAFQKKLFFVLNYFFMYFNHFDDSKNKF